MIDQQDFYQKQFHVDVREISLETETGNKLDIRPLLIQLNIYEDLFTPTLSGNIVISDQNDLLGKMPLHGKETLKIIFKTPGLENHKDYIDKTFSVYKIDGITKNENKNIQTYSLFFTTKEFIENARQLVSKSYFGTPSQIIEKVFNEYFPTGKLEELSASKNTVSFVSPGWKPFTLINWLSEVSISEEYANSHRFVFYETLDGFHFKDISEMLGDRVEYYYSSNDSLLQTIPGVNTTDSANKYSFFNQIVSMSVINPIDPYNRLKKGSYSNTILEHDITHKKYSSVITNYNTEFTKINHVYNNPLITDIDDLFISPDSLVMFVATNGPETEYQNTRVNRLSQMNLMGEQKIAITVHGNHSLRVGKMINVVLPRNIDITDLKDSKELVDETFSGNYLISAVHHIIVGTGYSCRVELIRDSLFRPLPDAVKIKDGDKIR